MPCYATNNTLFGDGNTPATPKSYLPSGGGLSGSPRRAAKGGEYIFLQFCHCLCPCNVLGLNNEMRWKKVPNPPPYSLCLCASNERAVTAPGSHEEGTSSTFFIRREEEAAPANEIIGRLAEWRKTVHTGRIGPLKGYYLFHHNHVRKRSVDRSEAHHNALNTEPEVRWVQQQHEKPRFKRDYSTFDQDFVRFPGFRSLVSGTRMAYRDTSTHNIFPDPLFKEQWYLQSVKM
uniref:S8_pro-domain domain-containing protein n=1 Tax=Anopheles merus TaxID=30066 RepID=A0A182UR37_ANOME